jgi:tRNA (guanine37-N1)-methyltransferase
MQFDVFTLLPEVFPPYLDTSILQRARERGLIDVRVHNIRDYAHDKHHTTDDIPYGGGGGMVMKPEPLVEAVETVLGLQPGMKPDYPIILLTPQGRVFNQSIAMELAQQARLALICGRYEGVDERIRRGIVSDEISIGDYVLTGGELPALLVIDAGPWTTRTRRGCWNIRTTRAHRNSAARRCRRCCSRATTRRSRAGGASNRYCGHSSAGPTCWRRQS